MTHLEFQAGPTIYFAVHGQASWAGSCPMGTKYLQVYVLIIWASKRLCWATKFSLLNVLQGTRELSLATLFRSLNLYYSRVMN